MRIDARTVYGWFREIIERTSRVHYSSDIIHVSEVSNCLRKAFYDRKVAKPTLDIKNILKVIGNGVHYQHQEFLRTKGFVTESEVKRDFKKFKLVGHIDLLNPKENLIIEIKTVNKIPQRPYLSHIRQLNAYLIMSRTKEGELIYISRDGGVKIYHLKPDKRLWRETVKRAFYLWHSLKENKPPEPEFSPLCNLCEFKWKCFSKRGDDHFGFK